LGPSAAGTASGLKKTPTGRRAPAPTVRAPTHAAYTLAQDTLPAPTLRRPGACIEERCTNRLTRRWRLVDPVSSGGAANRRLLPRHEASAGLLGAFGVDVKRARLALDHLGPDHDLFDAVEA